VWGKPAQVLQALGVVVGQQKGLQVLVEFVCRLVMEALNGGFLHRAVQALDLAISSRVRRFGQPMLHPIFTADAVETAPTRQKLTRLGRILPPLSVSMVWTL